jgi:hypothetical protein
MVCAAAIVGARPRVASGEPVDSPDLTDLRAQIERLQARIADLQAGQSRLDDATTDRTIHAVLDDAERQSQLLAAEGFTAGWDKGFLLRSADGAYSLKLGLLFQPRFVVNYRDDIPPDGDDDTQAGWEIKRTQLILNGTAISPDLNYWFMFESPQGGGLGLLDAWISYKFAEDWGFKAGQYFDPLSRELLNGPPRRLAVEPSLVDFYLAGGQADRVQGASLMYGLYKNENPLYVEVMAHDGARSRNTNFEDGQGSGNFGFAGRVEAKAFGDWASYKDQTAAGNKEDLLAFGAGVDFTEFDNAQQWLCSIDGQWETGKLALFAVLNLRYTDRRNVAIDSSFDYGALAQAAYLFTERWEVFGRYGYMDFENDPPAGDDQLHELTAGVNWYLLPATPHRAKMTIDLTYLPNGGGAGAKGFGVLGGTDDTEIVLRGQFQLLL